MSPKRETPREITDQLNTEEQLRYDPVVELRTELECKFGPTSFDWNDVAEWVLERFYRRGTVR